MTFDNTKKTLLRLAHTLAWLMLTLGMLMWIVYVTWYSMQIYPALAEHLNATMTPRARLGATLGFTFITMLLGIMTVCTGSAFVNAVREQRQRFSVHGIFEVVFYGGICSSAIPLTVLSAFLGL